MGVNVGDGVGEIGGVVVTIVSTTKVGVGVTSTLLFSIALSDTLNIFLPLLVFNAGDLWSKFFIISVSLL